MRGSGVTSQGVGVGIGGVRSSVGDKCVVGIVDDMGCWMANYTVDTEISHGHFGLCAIDFKHPSCF